MDVLGVRICAFVVWHFIEFIIFEWNGYILNTLVQLEWKEAQYLCLLKYENNDRMVCWWIHIHWYIPPRWMTCHGVAVWLVTLDLIDPVIHCLCVYLVRRYFLRDSVVQMQIVQIDGGRCSKFPDNSKKKTTTK